MAIPCPEFEWVEERDWATIANDPSLGAVMRGNRRTAARRTFHLGWENASPTDHAALLAEFDAALGRAGEVSYTPVDAGSPVTCEFVEDTFQSRWRNARGYAMRVTLAEKYTST